MLIARFETTTGPMTIGLVDLSREKMQVPLEALMTTLNQVAVLASTHAVVLEAPPGSPATFTFKYLRSKPEEFADQGALTASVNEHLARGVLQCSARTRVGKGGRIAGEFEYFELIAKDVSQGEAPTVH